jgi:hypothetical protein
VGRNVDVSVSLSCPCVIGEQREYERDVGAVLFADDEQWAPTIFKFITARCQANLSIPKGSSICFANCKAPASHTTPASTLDVAAARVVYLDGDRDGIMLLPERDPIQGGDAGTSVASARSRAGQFRENFVVQVKRTSWGGGVGRGPRVHRGIRAGRVCVARKVKGGELVRKSQCPVAE